MSVSASKMEMNSLILRCALNINALFVFSDLFSINLHGEDEGASISGCSVTTVSVLLIFVPSF